MRRIREFNKSQKESLQSAVNERVDQLFVERRSGLADRRKNHTFILNDRRSGIADRRKKAKLRS
jgi:hypothetical protein